MPEIRSACGKTGERKEIPAASGGKEETGEGRGMTIHEFGSENKNIVVLIHPSLVMWDYFEYLIPLMQNRYHLQAGDTETDIVI